MLLGLIEILEQSTGCVPLLPATCMTGHCLWGLPKAASRRCMRPRSNALLLLGEMVPEPAGMPCCS